MTLEAVASGVPRLRRFYERERQMKKVLMGLAALPFLAGAALAGQAGEPMQLTSQQMDKVTAGWSLWEVDKSNTSLTVVSVYQPNGNHIPPLCNCSGSGYYINIDNFALSVASAIGKY